MQNYRLMCAICGCGIDAGGVEALFTKDYKCLDCGRTFKGFGIKLACLYCQSKNVKRMR